MVQIERIEMVMIVEASTAFALYENNELDTTGVPLPEIDRVKADPVLSAEYVQCARRLHLLLRLHQQQTAV